MGSSAMGSARGIGCGTELDSMTRRTHAAAERELATPLAGDAVAAAVAPDMENAG